MRTKIENTEAMIFSPLRGTTKDISVEELTKRIERFEEKCQNKLINTLDDLGTTLTIKTDKFSLPYNREVKVTLYGESYMNGPFEFHRAMRSMVRTVLNECLFKVRGYVFVDFKGENDRHQFLKNFGQIDYYFRYHIKEEKKEV